LPYSEVKATAKSIATYCWKKDGYCYQEFIDRQTRKGKKGAEIANTRSACNKGGQARSVKYAELRSQAKKLKSNGCNNSEIAKQLNVSRQTVQNWLKVINKE